MLVTSHLSRKKISHAARPIIESLENRRLLSATVHHSAVHLQAQRITPFVSSQPSVTQVSPTNGATSVPINSPVACDLSLPNGAVDPTTVTNSTVTLVRTSDGTPISATVNTSGGGDSLVLQPNSLLTPFTQYTFTVTSGVKDVSGASFTPFSSTFTTGNTGGPTGSISFTKFSLPTAVSSSGDAFTCVRIGPDGKLYASTETGRILRWTINSDGTLGSPQVITSIQTHEGGNRLISGFTFDPSSTANNVVLWVSHTFYALSAATNGVDFTGKISVLSGPNLGTVQDAIINLPRSVSDHVNNQPVFQPGTHILFFAQGANNAFGAPDSTWGNRPNHMLNAAVLRLDTTKLNLSGGPLDVKTPDAGGTYDPFNSNNPLTIYATGVRNAFQIMFDDKGTLWAPVNGSSIGGNSPAFSSSDSGQVNGNRIDSGQPYSGPDVPGLTNVQETEDDFLDKIVQGGYYGHPNPSRGEFVLDGGNPTNPNSVTGQIFSEYPAGTNPDVNYRGQTSFDGGHDVYIWGPHHSPDGIIQYQSATAFGGALNGKLLIAEESAGDDVAVVTLDSNDNVVSVDRTISGLSGFSNPVNLVEDPNTGNIYVAEVGQFKLTLLKPNAAVGAPATPTNLQATASTLTGTGQVSLSWSAASGATSYRIQRQGPTDSAFVEIASGVTNTTFVDTAVTRGATYQYRVLAENSAGLSQPSAPVSATVPALPGRTGLNVTIGAGAAKSVRFVDSDGTQVVITLKGGGTVTASFSGDTVGQTSTKAGVVVMGTNVSLDGITGTGTGTKSALNINAHGGDKFVTLGGISTDGAFKAINANTTNLTGTLSAPGGVGNVNLASMNGATVSSTPSIGTLNLRHDSSLTLNGTSIRTLKVNGTLSGSTLNVAAINTLTTKALANTTINSAGNLGVLSLGTMQNSDIYAGISSIPAGQELPQASSSFITPALIKSIRLRSIKGVASDVNSSIAASQIGNVTLGGVQFANSGKTFGLAAHQIGSLALSDPSTGSTLHLRNITDSTQVTTALADKAISPGDFVVRIL